MSVAKANLAFKITNWCNLSCQHCCENSGPDKSPRLMDLDKMSQYLAEFNALPIEKYDTLVMTGGEVMSPYYHNNDTYIQQCIDIAFHGGMLPVLKTNGIWGKNPKLKNKIFTDIADIAYAKNKLVAMDISLDRFHDNLGAVADIINVLVREPAIGYCIATTLQGIYKNSTHAVHDLYSALLTRNIKIVGNDSQNKIILLSDDNNLYPLYYNFNQSIANVGRARTNKIGVFNLSGRPDIYGDCIMIDNNDVLRLNNVRGAKIDGRPILDVIRQLQQRNTQR